MELPELFKQVTVTWLKLYDFQALNMAISNTYLSGLPSWCPNYGAPPSGPLIFEVFDPLDCGYCSGIQDKVEAFPVIIDGDRLSVFGFMIDTIDNYCGPAEAFDLSNPRIKHVNAFLHWESRSLVLSQSLYKCESYPEAHWRTLTANKDINDVKWTESQELAYYEVIENFSRYLRDHTNMPGFSDPAHAFLLSMNNALGNRSFFNIITSRIGLGPGKMQKGDRICIVFGAYTPFVIRPVKDNPDLYEFVGETYIDGMMYGEALKLEAAREGSGYITLI